MDTADLYRLLSAFETGRKDAYHGDINEGVVDALKELIETREKIAEVKSILKEET